MHSRSLGKLPQCFRLNKKKCGRHWNSFSILAVTSPTMPHYRERCHFRQKYSKAKSVHCKNVVQLFSTQSSISSGSAILFSGGKNWRCPICCGVVTWVLCSFYSYLHQRHKNDLNADKDPIQGGSRR